MLSHLQGTDDINSETEFFSYEHFYVIYCKFWELDEDHDLVIKREQLLRHEGGGETIAIVYLLFIVWMLISLNIITVTTQ